MLALVLVALALSRAPITPQPAPDWSAWPAQGTVTSPFGDDGGRWHPGIDIGILRSLVVRAAEPGRVVAVGEPRGFEGYGNLVKVSLGGGWVALCGAGSPPCGTSPVGTPGWPARSPTD